jgi:hypothetical protein
VLTVRLGFVVFSCFGDFFVMCVGDGFGLRMCVLIFCQDFVRVGVCGIFGWMPFAELQ